MSISALEAENLNVGRRVTKLLKINSVLIVLLVVNIIIDLINFIR